MRKIINYIRSCFCKHEWEYLGRTEYFISGSVRPCKAIERWRCTKCGYIVKSKF